MSVRCYVLAALARQLRKSGCIRLTALGFPVMGWALFHCLLLWLHLYI